MTQLNIKEDYNYTFHKSFIGIKFPKTIKINVFDKNLYQNGDLENGLFLKELSVSFFQDADSDKSKRFLIQMRINNNKQLRPCLKLFLYNLQFKNGASENILYIIDRVIEDGRLRSIGLGDYLLEIVDEIAQENKCKYIWAKLMPSDYEHKITSIENLKKDHIKRGYKQVSEFFPENKLENVFAKKLF